MKKEPKIPAERKAAYISAEAQGFTVLGTPEELAQLLARQIGDSLAKRLSEQLAHNALCLENRMASLLRDQTSCLSNCGWSPHYGVWKPYEDKDRNAEPPF